LRKAIRQVFGDEVPVQRCVRHKERNVLELGPELGWPGSVEVRTEFRRWLEARGGVGKRAPGEALAIGKAKRAGLLLRGVRELEEPFVVAGGGGSGPVGVECDGPAGLGRVQARERVVGRHRRNPMSIRSRGPIALTVASAGSAGLSGTAGVAASMRSRSERRTRYMRQPFQPDRDRLAFARYLVDLGCQPPTAN
jgi:hypothetical protein